MYTDAYCLIRPEEVVASSCVAPRSTDESLPSASLGLRSKAIPLSCTRTTQTYPLRLSAGYKY